MTSLKKLIAFSTVLLFSVTFSDLKAMNPDGTWTPENYGRPSTGAPQHQADIDAATAAQRNGSGQTHNITTIKVSLDPALVEACVQSLWQALQNMNVQLRQLPTINLRDVILGRPEVKAKLDAIVNAIPQAIRTIMGANALEIAIVSVTGNFNQRINNMVQLRLLQQALSRQ